MTTLAFPDTTGKPTDGSFTYEANGVLYSWTGEYWAANNAQGFDQRYVNADGDQMTGDLTVPSLNGGPLAGYRNQLINGDFRVWQRGTTYTNDGGQGYNADRWKESGSTAGATVTRSTTVPAGFAYSAALTADAGSLQQGIELDEVNSNGIFAIGTTWTFSVWSTIDITGTASMCNFRRRVGLPAGTVEAGTFTNWVPTGEPASNGFTRYFATVTITGDASTGTDIVCLNINLPGGGAVGNAVNYAGAQLEPGPVATPFEIRPIGVEIGLCQRYFLRTDNSNIRFPVIQNANLEQLTFMIPTPVTMRAVPTVTGTCTKVGVATGTGYGTGDCVVGTGIFEETGFIRLSGSGFIATEKPVAARMNGNLDAEL